MGLFSSGAPSPLPVSVLAREEAVSPASLMKAVDAPYSSAQQPKSLLPATSLEVWKRADVVYIHTMVMTGVKPGLTLLWQSMLYNQPWRMEQLRRWRGLLTWGWHTVDTIEEFMSNKGGRVRKNPSHETSEHESCRLCLWKLISTERWRIMN